MATPIEVVVSGLEDGGSAWADMAYVAFQNRGETESVEVGTPASGLWRDSLAIAPRGEAS